MWACRGEPRATQQICASRAEYFGFGKSLSAILVICERALCSSSAARFATSHVRPHTCWYFKVLMLIGRQQLGQDVFVLRAKRHGAIYIVPPFVLACVLPRVACIMYCLLRLNYFYVFVCSQACSLRRSYKSTVYINHALCLLGL